MSNPKVKVPLTFLDYVLEIIGFGVFVAFWLYTFHSYKVLPDEIPSLYNSNGKIIEYTGKSTVFTPTYIYTAFYIYFTILGFFPNLYWQWSVTITPENALYQYRLGARFFRIIKILALSVVLSINNYSLWYDIPSFALIIGLSIVYSRIARKHG